MFEGFTPGKQNTFRTAAIILAAGYSSRMSYFKPLMSFGDSILVDLMVKKFRGAGVDDILVVYGHHSDEMKIHLPDLPVIPVHNPDYASGMFSSVLAGVKKVQEMQVDAFFIIPVDYPLVQPATIALLLEVMSGTEVDVFHPTYEKEPGHPVLIHSRVIPEIIAHSGKDGLHGALSSKELLCGEIEVCDCGILLDMDTDEDCESLRNRYQNDRNLLNRYEDENDLSD